MLYEAFSSGAAERNRTFDLTLTKGMLYQLSYGSELFQLFPHNRAAARRANCHKAAQDARDFFTRRCSLDEMGRNPRR